MFNGIGLFSLVIQFNQAASYNLLSVIRLPRGESRLSERGAVVRWSLNLFENLQLSCVDTSLLRLIVESHLLLHVGRPTMGEGGGVGKFQGWGLAFQSKCGERRGKGRSRSEGSLPGIGSWRYDCLTQIVERSFKTNRLQTPPRVETWNL